MTDLFFILIFLPSAVLLYWICSTKYRQFLLVLLNIIFYSSLTGGRVAAALMFSAIINIVLVSVLNRTDRQKLRFCALFVGIICNLLPLMYCKYAGFGLSLLGIKSATLTLIIPLGISFYTFKAISLIIDSFQGKVTPDPINAFIYLTFFGQIISGPISRYDDIDSSAICRLSIKKDMGRILDSLSHGAVRFSIGLAKKVLVADVLENIVSDVFVDAATVTDSGSLILWGGSICYSIQLFMDFSGYSDMAIGVSEMFGYKCPENFNYPYTSKSVSEFWRRWHISLGSWFRDYVYIPMGGREVSKPRLFVNLMMVWFLTGMWHGANWTFIFWGVSYGIIISIEKFTGLCKKLTFGGSVIYRLLTLIIVNSEWIIFRSESLSYALNYLKSMFVFGIGERDARAIFLLWDYKVFIFAAILCSVPLTESIKKWFERKKTGVLYLIVSRVSLVVLVMASISFIVAGSNNPFAYANF